MRNVILRVAALGAALALLPCAGHAQIFFDPATPPASNVALCVSGTHAQISTTPGTDCSGFVNNGGTDKIVLGSSNTITLQGAPGGGDIIVGNGTSVTTLDGTHGDVSIGGKLSMNGLTGSVDMGGLVVQNVGTPVTGTDAANKAYVDTAVSNSHTVTNGFGDTASITSDVGNLFAGFKATSGTDSRTAALSAAGLTLNNGTVDTVVLDTKTGNASFSGNVNVGGGLTVTGGSTLNGGATVNGGFTANGGSTLNGGATVNGPTQLNGSLTVAPGNNIDMGGNQIHNVAAGVAPTDAVNVSQLGSSVNTLNQRIDRVSEGVAIAMSVQNPVLTGGDRFGVAVNWGDYAGNNAVGAAAVGILNQNVFGGGEKFGVTGAFGVSSSQVAGRVGVQLTW